MHLPIIARGSALIEAVIGAALLLLALSLFTSASRRLIHQQRNLRMKQQVLQRQKTAALLLSPFLEQTLREGKQTTALEIEGQSCVLECLTVEPFGAQQLVHCRIKQQAAPPLAFSIWSH